MMHFNIMPRVEKQCRFPDLFDRMKCSKLLQTHLFMKSKNRSEEVPITAQDRNEPWLLWRTLFSRQRIMAIRRLIEAPMKSQTRT